MIRVIARKSFNYGLKKSVEFRNSLDTLQKFHRNKFSNLQKTRKEIILTILYEN
jgi:hypothetical protein